MITPGKGAFAQSGGEGDGVRGVMRGQDQTTPEGGAPAAVKGLRDLANDQRQHQISGDSDPIEGCGDKVHRRRNASGNFRIPREESAGGSDGQAENYPPKNGCEEGERAESKRRVTSEPRTSSKTNS